MAAEPDANVRTTERGVSKPRTAVLRQLRGHASRRLGWGLADQVVSSLTNYAVGIYVVHALGAVQFGAFSLAYVTYAFALNASRGLATDPLMVRFSGTDLPTWRRAVTDCTGTAAVMGLVTGACVVAAAGVLSGVVGSAFLALGLTLPGLLLQDSWRYSFFALGRGSRAFVNDTVWALTLIPALVVLRATHHADVFWVVFAWGITATIAAAVGPIQARVIPRLAGARRWVSQHRDLGPRYLAEGTSQSASVQLRAYSIGSCPGPGRAGLCAGRCHAVRPDYHLVPRDVAGGDSGGCPGPAPLAAASAAVLRGHHRRAERGRARLGNHPAGRGAEGVRSLAAGADLAVNISAGAAPDDLRHRPGHGLRRRHGPACSRGVAAEPAPVTHHVRSLRHRLSGGCCC